MYLKVKSKYIRFFINLANSLKALKDSLLKSVFKTTIPELNDSNTSIFILGNGPSLIKDIALYKEQLQSSTLMVVNLFVSTDLYTELKPKYYFIGDGAFWVDNVTEQEIDLRNQFFKEINEKTNWNLYLLCPITGYKKIKERINNKHIKFITLNNHVVIDGFEKFNHFLLDRKLGFSPGMTILNASLIASIWFGYKNLYLLGANHNWFLNLVLDQDNKLWRKEEHFYEEVEDKLYEINTNLEFQMWCQMKAVESYRSIYSYAKYNQVEIYNCTTDSYIDTLPRKALKEIFPSELVHQS